MNKEVQTVRRLLLQYGLTVTVKPLPDKPRPPRQITPDEWGRFVQAGSGNQDWTRAFAVGVITAATGLSRKQLRRLTWESVDPFAETVAGSPFTAEARDVLFGLERRRMFTPGRCRASDLLLNFRSWRDAWTAMTKSCGLEGVTLSDVRAIQSRV